MTMTKQALESTLGTLNLRDLKYDVETHGSSFIVFIESSDFSTMDEADRQQLVWDHLIANFGDDELVKIMLVYTISPEEATAASAE
jgi:acid stress-induced BolA-like protein IbaG/YrbA